MGSGRGGAYRGTWGSREGEELRARVGEALGRLGDAAAAAELAGALVHLAAPGTGEESEPVPGEVAFDLALDALSSFVPGGGRVTREICAAARKSGSSKAFQSALERGIVSDFDLEQNAELANELFRITEAGNFGDGGKSKGVRCIYGSDPMADSLELFERLGRGAKDDDTFMVEGGTLRWLADRTSIVHRSFTSTPDSPAVEIGNPGTDKVRQQKIHFIYEE